MKIKNLLSFFDFSFSRTLVIGASVGLALAGQAGSPESSSITTPPAAVEAPRDVTGFWTTIDDNTQKPKSVVEIREINGEIQGHVVKLLNREDGDTNPKCDKCKGDRKDQPIIGMKILWDMKKKADHEWAGGEILDPKNGKSYSCKLELVDEGKKLKVRGFIGISLLGRTQVWERSENPVQR